MSASRSGQNRSIEGVAPRRKHFAGVAVVVRLQVAFVLKFQLVEEGRRQRCTGTGSGSSGARNNVAQNLRQANARATRCQRLPMRQRRATTDFTDTSKIGPGCQLSLFSVTALHVWHSLALRHRYSNSDETIARHLSTILNATRPQRQHLHLPTNSVFNEHPCPTTHQANHSRPNVSSQLVVSIEIGTARIKTSASTRAGNRLQRDNAAARGRALQTQAFRGGT
jgi:hypothetical protein